MSGNCNGPEPEPEPPEISLAQMAESWVTIRAQMSCSVRSTVMNTGLPCDLSVFLGYDAHMWRLERGKSWDMFVVV